MSRRRSSHHASDSHQAGQPRNSRRRQARKDFERRTPVGSSPGQVVADPCAAPTEVHIIAYGPERIEEYHTLDGLDLAKLREQFPVVWIQVAGLRDAGLIKRLGEHFQLHPLAMEDVVNVHQRPKLELYPQQIFVIGRMVTISKLIRCEQVAFFLGDGYLLTFIEDPGDLFDPVRQRVRTSSGRIRRSSPAYLLYALLDSVVDAHFPVLEELGDRLEALEDGIVLNPDTAVIGQIHDIKHEIRALRREIWPTREVCSQLTREKLPWIDDDVRIYLRDCYDHTVQILDLIETYRELGADMTDLYLSSQSHRMNEIMKVLTIIATIFMPLSFVVGVYGMNFSTDQPGNMPELSMPYAYPVLWVVMLVIAAGMMWYFYRKGWVGRSKSGVETAPK